MAARENSQEVNQMQKRFLNLLVGMLVVLLPSAAVAGDVTVELDAGAGFSVKNSGGSVERLRVDEATGNISRNGFLFVHTTGTNNTFVGAGAGNASTTGSSDSAFGTNALQSNTSANGNSAFGSEALSVNTTGRSNSAFGEYSLVKNTTGRSNSAFGATALYDNTTGRENSAFGESALNNNTTGYRNVAIGRYAGRIRRPATTTSTSPTTA